MAGYSDTPLVKKLGIKPKDKIKIVGAPDEYWSWISPVPEGVSTTGKYFNFIHLFSQKRKSFEKDLLSLQKRMTQDGMIWVSWPKKSAKMDSDLDENIIRDFALKNKLVDIKVCAVSDLWSGLKLVIPVKLRKTSRKPSEI
jgi:hypothetical protein